jgi:hypothetical protein
MLDGIKQWLAQNELWLTGALAVIGIIEWFFKPLRWAIPKLWYSLNCSFRVKQPCVTLRFVARGFPHRDWGIGSQGDKPILCIATDWHVTHVPGSGSAMPIRLLNPHLVEPFAKYLIHIHAIISSENSLEGVIPEGETRNLIIQCYLSKVLKSEKPIKVRLTVEDQLANKHKLPPVVVKQLPWQAAGSNPSSGFP